MNNNGNNHSSKHKHVTFDIDDSSILSISKFATQFPVFNSSGQKNQICDIVIGFDFGSSCTKVVLQAPYFTGRWAHVVPFNECGYFKNKNFLPTKIYCDSIGRFSLIQINDVRSFSKIKTNLLNNPDKSLEENIEQFQINLTPRILTIAYIASVLREVRQWFLTTQYNIFSSYKIRWHLNIGMPSAGYNDSEQKKLFENIAQVSWLTSTIPGNIKMKRISMTLKYSDIQEKIKDDISPEDINVIPEVAAEVVGYARSSLRETGLYVLIDIGARTLDIASFILHNRNGDDRYSILTADLEELGATVCDYNRFKALANELIRLAQEHNEDLIAPIPASLNLYTQKFNTNERVIIEDFYGKCKNLISKTIRDLRKNRDPNSDRWYSGLPIFLCGGGKNIELYKQVIEENHSWLLHNTNSKGLIIREIPKPENLKAENLKNEDFHRFAVAYGLSFPCYDIGEIKPPQEIKNIQRPEPKDFSDRFIAKEHV